jgi:hypothetical protein
MRDADGFQGGALAWPVTAALLVAAAFALATVLV